MHSFIDLTQHPFMIVMQPETNLLNHVQLTQSMADELLVRIHPFFKDVRVIKGNIHMQMDHFHWPLNQRYIDQADLSGRLFFYDVELRAGGFIAKILNLLKISEQTIAIDEREISFRAKNGDIQCSPMKLRVGEHLLTISGRMGYDQSLDFTIHVPITEKLVSEALYPYLKENTLNIPIKGYVSNPQINHQSFYDALSDLIKQVTGRFFNEQLGGWLFNIIQE